MKPILLNPREVTGVLSGHVGLLLRPLKPQPAAMPGHAAVIPHIDSWYELDVPNSQRGDDKQYKIMVCPFGRAGKELWVREVWGLKWNESATQPEDMVNGIAYRASGDTAYRDCWFSAGRMKQKDSRITLRLLSVSVVRLADITEREAYAFGVTDTWPLKNLPYLSGYGGRAVLNNLAHQWEKEHPPLPFATSWAWSLRVERIEAK